MTSRRSLPVPEGLDGLRLDAAISRLFGLSRTAAAELVSAGAASLDGVVSAKSERVTAGAVLDVDLPEVPFIDLQSGYVLRSIRDFPRQGRQAPWRVNQNYVLDRRMFRAGPGAYDGLEFAVRPARAEVRAA